MKVLISGAGIAGPTLAYWLARYGHQPTIVERAPRLRTGGYVIDFWGVGFDIAERMGLLPDLRRQGYMVQEVRVVDRRGKRVAGFPVQVFSRMTGGRYLSIERGGLAAAIFRALPPGVERIFGVSVTSIVHDDLGARVTFSGGETREFDVVVGADGLHSNVRRLAFGPEERFEKYLGFKVAAFEAEGYQPRDELIYFMYSEIGQQVARFTMRDDRTLFLFTFADPDPQLPGDLPSEKALLQHRYVNSGWECPQILDALDRAGELYFDRVSQIRMGDEPGSWSRGRVTLLGDAASCVSLLAGQGSALAMIAGYVLAGELHRAAGDYARAFTRYQELFGPFVARKQKAALRLAGTFAPKSRLSMFLRNRVMDLLTIPAIARLAARDLTDDFVLPDY